MQPTYGCSLLFVDTKSDGTFYEDQGSADVVLLIQKSMEIEDDLDEDDDSDIGFVYKW